MATAKKAAAPSSGAAELKAFKAAVQNLKMTGRALAKLAKAKGNGKLRESSGLRAARIGMINTAASLAKAIPGVDPPPTIL